MNKLLKLLLGLILFFLFGYWCIYVKSAPTIQNDIKDRASAALHKAGYDSVNLDVQGRDIILTGTVPKEGLRSVVEQAVNIEGVRFIENQIAVNNELGTSDYYLNVSKSEANTVKLEGYIADTITHHNFVSYVMETFNTTSIDDQLVEKAEPPKNWTAISKSALDALKQLQNGKLQISNGQVQLSGKVSSNDSREEIINQLSKQLPSSISTTTRIDIVPIASLPKPDQEEKPILSNDGGVDEGSTPLFTSATCQKNINEVLSKTQINFKSGSSDIEPSSFSLLNEILDIKANCPKQNMRIKGHTDALGDNNFNQQLSEQRASSVRAYFVEKGLDINNMTAEGFGENQPIADNRSWTGRKMNRRIEITIEESK